MLTNVLYFKCAWTFKFRDANKNQDLQFKLLDGSAPENPEAVQWMTRSSKDIGTATVEFPGLPRKRYTAVSIPYEVRYLGSIRGKPQNAPHNKSTDWQKKTFPPFFRVTPIRKYHLDPVFISPSSWKRRKSLFSSKLQMRKSRKRGSKEADIAKGNWVCLRKSEVLEMTSKGKKEQLVGIGRLTGDSLPSQ